MPTELPNERSLRAPGTMELDPSGEGVALDVAVVIAALGGVAICGAVLTLFVGTLRDAAVASVLFCLFGAAIVCTLASLTAFAVEMMLASRTVRTEVAKQQQEDEEAAR